MVTSLTDPYWYLHILSIKTRQRQKVFDQSRVSADLELQNDSTVDHLRSRRSTTNGSNIALDSYPMGSSVLERNHNDVHENQPSEHESTEEVPDSESDRIALDENAIHDPQLHQVRDIPRTRDETVESLKEFGSAYEKFDATGQNQSLEYDSAINLSRLKYLERLLMLLRQMLIKKQKKKRKMLNLTRMINKLPIQQLLRIRPQLRLFLSQLKFNQHP